jgi:hypothetical protein
MSSSEKTDLERDFAAAVYVQYLSEAASPLRLLSWGGQAIL